MSIAEDPVVVNESNYEQFLSGFDTVFTDADGVLWQGDDVIGNAIDVLNAFISAGKRVFIITNNSTKTRDEYVIKCNNMGLDLSSENILCTAHAAATFLKQMNFSKTAYVVGQVGIAKELDAVDIKYIGIGSDVVKSESVFDAEYDIDPEVGAVIVGFDSHLSYNKICKACTYLKNPNCLFVATNGDLAFPSKRTGLMFPGTGCMVNSIALPSGRKPFVMGKPSTYMYEDAAKAYNINPQRTLMIGDRADTDILFGYASGMKTLLVLSGITTEENIKAWKSSNDPADKKLIANFVLPKLGDLLPFIRRLPK